MSRILPVYDLNLCNRALEVTVSILQMRNGGSRELNDFPKTDGAGIQA